MSGLTIDDCSMAIRKLGELYTQPKPTLELAKLWWDVLGSDVKPAAFRAAVRRYMESDRTYWPKPGQIRTLAQQIHALGQTNTSDDERRPATDGPCPVCGARLRALTADERGITEVWHGRKLVPLRLPNGDPNPVLEGWWPPDRYGVLHELGAHERAKIPAYGYARRFGHQGAA